VRLAVVPSGPGRLRADPRTAACPPPKSGWPWYCRRSPWCWSSW